MNHQSCCLRLSLHSQHSYSRQPCRMLATAQTYTHVNHQSASRPAAKVLIREPLRCRWREAFLHSALELCTAELSNCRILYKDIWLKHSCCCCLLYSDWLQKAVITLCKDARVVTMTTDVYDAKQCQTNTHIRSWQTVHFHFVLCAQMHSRQQVMLMEE